MACHGQLIRMSLSGPARGFSLIELLISTALVLVMFVLYFNPNAKHYQVQQQAVCRTHLQFDYAALQSYTRDNNGAFPAVKNAKSAEEPLSLLVPRSTTSTEYFLCPGTKHRP